ncbi:hypothetical protein MPSEU_000241400 [Mayamaea pseudoterrestris]|nr:hypothetical protein MPSEU_000241400 [Mayamaea pseudoterrestris]
MTMKNSVSPTVSGTKPGFFLNLTFSRGTALMNNSLSLDLGSSEHESANGSSGAAIRNEEHDTLLQQLEDGVYGVPISILMAKLPSREFKQPPSTCYEDTEKFLWTAAN